MTAEVTLPDGQVVRLHGYADRLELDEDGRVVVVDLKTGKYMPTGQGRPVQLPARALPARRRPRRSRRAGRPVGGIRRSRAGPAPGRRRPAQGPAPVAPVRRRRSSPGRGAADVRRSRAACRGVRRPARRRTAIAARSRRSAPTRPPGRFSDDRPRHRHPRAAARRAGRGLRRSATSSSPRSPRPLEPAVVIAGAGSGKTTVMAARVVWLVATGTGRARRGARAHLHDQGDRRAGQPDPRQPATWPGCSGPGPAPHRRRRGGGRGADGRDLPLLRRGAALRARPADRPRARHPADRRRQPLPARRPRRAALHRAGHAPHRLAPSRRPVPPRARRGR